jgi:kynurenine formamidase
MRSRITATALGLLALALALPSAAGAQAGDLWKVYDRALSKAKYIDLTNTLYPGGPVWSGFGPAQFKPTVNPTTGLPYTYAADGFEATSYLLSTDQFGTQFDPPAHWAPEQAAIDEVPASYAVRPLVVINIAAEARKDPQYFVHVADVKAWERKHGRIPAGSVVFVRSDWSKQWTADPVKAKELAASRDFTSVGLDALKFLASQAPHPLPRPRAAGHGLDADARGRVLADAQRLRAGRGRGEPRRRARDGLPGLVRLPQVQGWSRRLRALRRDLPAEDEEGRADQPRRRAAARIRQRPALGRRAGLPGALSLSRGEAAGRLPAASAAVHAPMPRPCGRARLPYPGARCSWSSVGHAR